MANLPSGTVTMLFTDIAGSTRLLQEIGRDSYIEALRLHRRLLRAAASRHGGVEVEMQGDCFLFAFAGARPGVAAAAEMQRDLAGHDWPEEPIHVRIGIHTGAPAVDGDRYAGLDVHRAARVMSAGHGGQILVSAETYAATGDELPDGLALRDLGEHRLKDLLEPQGIYQLVVPGLPDEFPALAALGTQVGLPVPPNRLVGREQELGEIASLVESGTRLLTLVGPGGTGKTRLAVQAAAELSDRFPDGVWFVALAPIRDEALVLGEIARTVGYREQPDTDPIGGLAAALAGKRALLLLDNFEHVGGAAPSIPRLLAGAADLNVLATSREPLHVSGEQVLAIEPLPIDTDAAILFAERARAATGDFSLSDANVATVAAICARLDGLPLALELAAARIPLLSPQALLARLDESLGLLTGGPRDAEDRQRTLRGTIDWSYELLTVQEQELFARLAVFAGGARLDAVEGVVGPDVLDGLSSLVDKSLLRRSDDPDGEPRFWLLETMREYAAERAEAAEVAGATRQRHAEHFLAFAEQADPEFRGPRNAEWIDRMEREHDNLRAALTFLIGTGQGEPALRLAAITSRLWIQRGYLSEGRDWLEAALALEGPSPSRARALRRLAIHSCEVGAIDRAASSAGEALELDRAAGDGRGVAESAGILADVAAHRGDLETAGAMYEEAVAQARAAGDERELAISLYNLANVRHLQGADTEAEALFEEAQSGFRALGDALGLGGSLLSLVGIVSPRRDYVRVSELLSEAAELLAAIGFTSGLLDVVEASGRVAVETGRMDAAARLFGAFHARNEEIGRAGVHPAELAAHDASIGAVRSALGAEPFDEAWQAGAALGVEAAVAEALETVSAIAAREASLRA